MNNGWDLGVWWAKSFHAGVLKCGPRPFALAEATGRCSALISVRNKGCELSVTGLHQYSAVLEGSHHMQACTCFRGREDEGKRGQGREGGRDYMSYQ